MKSLVIRFWSAVGVLLGSGIAIAGFSFSQPLCLGPAFVPNYSCPPSDYYYLGSFGVLVAIASFVSLIVSLFKSRTNRNETEETTN